MVAWIHTAVQFVLMLAKRLFVDENETVILDGYLDPTVYCCSLYAFQFSVSVIGFQMRNMLWINLVWGVGDF